MIGKGENIHHLIYIDDLIEGLFLSAKAQEAVGEIFVLSGKEPVTSNEMVKTIAAELGAKVPRFRAPFAPFLAAAILMETTLRPMGIQPPLHRRRMDFFKKSFLFSQEKSINILGFRPRFSFRQGVAETAQWYMEMGLL